MSDAPLVPVPRQVRTIYAVRMLSFVWCFLVVGLHLWERGFGAPLWIAAALHFFAWPHLAWLRASRARDPRRAEIQHLYADAFMLGAWIAVLEFPVWIAYPMIFAPALNGIVNRGLPGLGLSLMFTCLGVLGGVLLHGTPHQNSIGKAATHGCMRLRDEDIEWLYQFVPVGTKLYIF